MNVTVTDVLGSLFNPTDTVCFRVFDDKKGGVFQGSKLSCECGKYKSIEDTLKNHNAMNRGIFFVVNYGGQDDDSITRINAQFVEMDNDSFEDQQKKIDAFPLPPSMIMKTQKSYHVYWFMDSTAKVERFRMIQTQLVKHFDLKQKDTSLKMVPSSIIGRDPNANFYSFTIDEGSISGISVNDPVITDKGLVGWVYSVSANSCKVKSILSPETNVGVVDIRTGDSGVIKGSVKLAKDNPQK